jgi:hypothetical protein
MPAEAGGQSTGVLKNARRLGVLLYSARRLRWFFFSTPVLTPPALSNLVARVNIMSCEPRFELSVLVSNKPNLFYLQKLDVMHGLINFLFCYEHRHS